MQRIYDMIIIGGGPAGYTTALYATRAGLDVALIERMTVGGQMAVTGDIDNYPGFDEGIDGFTLASKMQQGAEKFGAQTIYDDVSSVDFSADIKKVFTTQGEYNAKTVVIATGANPKLLGLNNEYQLTGKGVHYCAHCDGRFYKNKTVVVVGGGNTAVSDALYLSRLVKKVFVINRSDTLRATKIYHEPLLKASNVEVIFNSQVVELIASDKLTGVVVNSKDKGQKQIDCDGVFVSIGRTPATEFLKDSVKIDKDGYIVADESTRTNVSGVYAVGDVRSKVVRQVITAASDGAVASYYAEQYLDNINN